LSFNYNNQLINNKKQYPESHLIWGFFYLANSEVEVNVQIAISFIISSCWLLAIGYWRNLVAVGRRHKAAIGNWR